VDARWGPEGASAPAPRPAGAERRVALGGDHGGFALKDVLKSYIEDELGWSVHDCGTWSSDAVDYPTSPRRSRARSHPGAARAAW